MASFPGDMMDAISLTTTAIVLTFSVIAGLALLVIAAGIVYTVELITSKRE